MSQFPIRTPEGVVLEFHLAGIELRLMAFVLDMMIVFGVNILVGVFVLIGIFTFEFTGWLSAAYMAFFFLSAFSISSSLRCAVADRRQVKR